MSFEMKGNQLRLDGRRIGWITTSMDKKRIYVTARNRRNHFFRIHQGWGLAVAVLNFLKENNFAEVHIRIGKRVTLISNLEDWFSHGIKVHYEPYEEQLVLPEKHMRKHTLTLGQVLE